jgi:NAD(P)-dependent dehydrogenase (short-subunit alcohol dehydrogenase family)
VVTGAGQGIGAGVARRFAAEGARVAVLDHNAHSAAAVASELGNGSVAVEVDLRDPQATAAAMDETIGDFGGCDVLVNNAGVFAKVPLVDITVAQWDEMFAVNLRSMLLTMQSVVPAMQADGGGRIVNMSSMAAKVGTPGEAHYAAAKAGVVALTRVAAMELGPLGITVNAVCPGYVLTEMGADNRTDEQVAGWAASSPLGRVQTVGHSVLAGVGGGIGLHR